MTGWEMLRVAAVLALGAAASAFPLVYLIASWRQRRRSRSTKPPADFGPGSPAWIHPQANVYGSQIGNGTKVAAFAEIGGAEVGHGCKIQSHASISPGCTIGDGVLIGPGARLLNDRRGRAAGSWVREGVTVADCATIGGGAIVLAGVYVGASATVAAGAVVTRDVPDGQTVVGVPARPMFVADFPQSDFWRFSATRAGDGGPAGKEFRPGADTRPPAAAGPR